MRTLVKMCSCASCMIKVPVYQTHMYVTCMLDKPYAAGQPNDEWEYHLTTVLGVQACTRSMLAAV